MARVVPEVRSSRARVSFHARSAKKGNAMTDAAVVTEKLTRRFGGLLAVDSIDLQVAAGQFFGFLGPNGAGKSTTIKMLTGLVAPRPALGIGFFFPRRGSEASDRCRARRHGFVRALDRLGVSEFCWPHVWAG